MQTLLSQDIFPSVAVFIADRKAEFDLIPIERKAVLERLSGYARARIIDGKTAHLVFICTHNSRRSQFAQVWAQVAADLYNLKIKTYSGGTETTAFNPRAIESLRRVGLSIEVNGTDEGNPHYLISYAQNGARMSCFSKKFCDEPNPRSGYCAVMTCSHADEACPMVIGCDLRIPVMYDDPKVADDTVEEVAVYDQRSRQICREMLYVMDSTSKSI